MKLDVRTKHVFTAISPIRNGFVWNSDRTIAAFATLHDICLCHASAFNDYTIPPIATTIPLTKPVAALSFAQSANKLDKDILLLINSTGNLITYAITKNHLNQIQAVPTSTGEPSDVPSDFCHAQVYGPKKTVVSFWCRRDDLFWRSSESTEIHHYKLKADIKCFSSVVIDGYLFCSIGCVNGNVYFVEINTSNLAKLQLVSLLSPFAIPVLCVAITKIGNDIACAFCHGIKVTVVRWESALAKPLTENNLKIRRDIMVAGQSRTLSTDMVIGDFNADICNLSFDETGKKLLAITNETQFGVYEFRSDTENGGDNWFNLVLGGEASERPFGYCGGGFIPNTPRFIIYTTRGSFLVFDIVQEDDFFSTVEVSPPITGHQSSVVSAEWDSSGELLFTAGYRDREIHVMATLKDGTFAQISRPESHQYDIHRMSLLSGLSMIVGSDELPFRVYKAPKSFTYTIEQLTNIKLNQLKRADEELPSTAFFKQPVLGVQNVAANDDQEEELNFADFKLKNRPTTNQLMKYTYWEVAESLYGHSNPSSCLAISPDGNFLATCCLSTSIREAAIFVRKISDWDIVSKLEGHTLTVTNIVFSPNSEYLVSVSRDRSYAVFHKESDSGVWTETIRMPDAHKRMILTAAWVPDSTVFVTGGRDAILAFWSAADGTLLGSETLAAPVMAVDVSKTMLNNGSLLVAIGLGNGQVLFASLNLVDLSNPIFTVLHTVTDADAFSLSITTVRFRPNNKTTDNNQLVAVGSDSSIVKVYSVTTPV